MDSTPDEIRRICEEEIQPKWIGKKKVDADKLGRVEWNLPVVKLSDLPDYVDDLLDSVDKDKGNER